VYNGGVSLQRCPRAHCGGSILWGCCLLCGRDPKNPATVGTHHQHREHQAPTGGAAHGKSAGRSADLEHPARADPYLSLARRVLAIPERAPQWDPALQAYVIDVLD